MKTRRAVSVVATKLHASLMASRAIATGAYPAESWD